MTKRLPALLLALCALPVVHRASAATETATAAPAAEPTVEAYWSTTEIDFAYMGMTTYYSCEGLRDSVRDVLRMLGARDDLRVRARGCEVMGGPAAFPRVLITVTVPVEATPENLAELAKDADKRELVARVRGERQEGAEGPDRFPAIRRQVVLSDRASRDLDPGECELIEQMRNRVFPRLGIRIVEDRLNCVPRRVTPGQLYLVVEALFEAPRPDDIGKDAGERSSGKPEEK